MGWREEQKQKFIDSLDKTQFKLDTIESNGYANWTVKDNNDWETWFSGGLPIVKQDPTNSNRWQILIDGKGMGSGMAYAISGKLPYGLRLYSEHDAYSIRISDNSRLTSARYRRIKIHQNMFIVKHNEKWVDEQYLTPPNFTGHCAKRKTTKTQKATTHEFITWFSFKGKEWIECKHCNEIYGKNDATDPWLRLDTQGWRIRNAIRDFKREKTFLINLPGTVIHYDPTRNYSPFIVIRKRKNPRSWQGPYATTMYNDADVPSYLDILAAPQEPASDAEPSYADFKKLAKEMRP